MKKISLTILHKLPNRIRFRVSQGIKDMKSFSKSMKTGDASIHLRYNFRVNTLLVEFNPEEILLQEVIYRVVTALSIENGMLPVRLLEEDAAKSLNSLSIYSGASIALAYLMGLRKRTSSTVTENMNRMALALTTTAIGEHAYSETKKKGFFDIEILPALYILKSYIEEPSISAIALMWITTFGRHLAGNHSVAKEIRVFRILDKSGKYQYIADVRDDNSIRNLSDLVHHIFFHQRKAGKGAEKYITIKEK